MESQARLHGLDPAEAIVELLPRPGEHTLRTADIEAKIRGAGRLAGHRHHRGRELLHRAGLRHGRHHPRRATPWARWWASTWPTPPATCALQLHDWDVDFACWCSYKYLNSGPGGTSGVFVHERFAHRPDLPRLAGWWGHDPADRFQMKKGFRPMPGAAGWQLTNAQIFPMAMHRVSLEMVDRAGGMAALRRKSEQLTGYLEYLIQQLGLPRSQLEIITPADPAQRGCQLSLLVHERGRELFDFLAAQGVIADWREPNVIRLAPVPLYNSFEDVRRAGEALPRICNEE